MQLLTNNQGGRNRPIFYAKQENQVLENYAIKIKFCKIDFFIIDNQQQNSIFKNNHSPLKTHRKISFLKTKICSGDSRKFDFQKT